MAVLAIAALLSTLAVPGFAGLRRAAGMSGAANELLWALHLARSSAAVRGVPVSVCLTGTAGLCIPGPDAVAAGWLVFQSGASVKAVEPAPAAAILHRFELPEDVTVTATRPAVTFWPVARAGSTSTFELCDPRGKVPGRLIVVSQTGRPRVAQERASCAG